MAEKNNGQIFVIPLPKRRKHEDFYSPCSLVPIAGGMLANRISHVVSLSLSVAIVASF